MNEWQTVLSVIDESNPDRVDTVGHNFGGMYKTAWGVVDPPGQVPSVLYPEWCNDHCWKLVAVAGSLTVNPRVSEVNWSLYRWFRYRGAAVTPRLDSIVVPGGKIVDGDIVLPDTLWGSGEVDLESVPAFLPPSEGARSLTIQDAAGVHTVAVRLVGIVADTSRFFVFAALPSDS
jgi:hypothetical protein